MEVETDEAGVGVGVGVWYMVCMYRHLSRTGFGKLREYARSNYPRSFLIAQHM